MNWITSLPKGVLIFLLLGGGIFLIVAFNPPYTVCDSQLEIFKKNQTRFIYIDPKEKLVKTARIETFNDSCKMANSPGGCYELFMKMKRLLRDLENAPRDCADTLSSLPEVKKALWRHMRLMVDLAWGEKPPTSYYEKLAWFDAADLSLYCNLKKDLETFYGTEEFSAFREKLFGELPGAKSLSRDQVWNMMLLSTDCRKYL